MAESKYVIQFGQWVKHLRVSQGLTQLELAGSAKVSPRAVDLLEHNQPLPLDDKRKILAELYARKISKSGKTSSRYTKV